MWLRVGCGNATWGMAIAFVLLLSGKALSQTLYWTEEGAGNIWRSNTDGTDAQVIVSGLNFPRGIAYDAVNQKLYWTEFDSVKRSDPDGANVEVLLDTVDLMGQAPTSAIDIDAAAEYVFFGRGSSGSLVRVEYSGNGLLLVPFLDIRSLQVDSVNNKIYYVNAGQDVRRINYDGTGSELLFDTTGFPNPATDLEVDLAAGYAYMCDSVGPSFAIYRTQLDGSNRVTIYSSAVSDVEVDASGGTIYFTDFVSGTVRRANLDGTNVVTLATGLNFPTRVVLAPAAGIPCAEDQDCVLEDDAPDAACTLDRCVAGICMQESIEYGDVNGTGPDAPNLDDILCCLGAFGNFGSCPNADIRPMCSGDDIINLDDILGVLAAFGGADPCGCTP